MTAVWQQLVVAALVVAAAASAFWRLAPATLKLRMLDRLGHTPLQGAWLAKRRAKLQSGCANCGSRQAR